MGADPGGSRGRAAGSGVVIDEPALKLPSSPAMVDALKYVRERAVILVEASNDLALHVAIGKLKDALGAVERLEKNG
jgi:hypothetical protein